MRFGYDELAFASDARVNIIVMRAIVRPLTPHNFCMTSPKDVGYEFQLEGARGDHFEMYADTDEARVAWMNTLTHVIAVADARAEFLRNKGIKIQRKEDFQSMRSLEGGIEKTDSPTSPRKQPKQKSGKKNASAALKVGNALVFSAVVSTCLFASRDQC